MKASLKSKASSSASARAASSKSSSSFDTLVPDFSDIPAGELPDFTEIRKSFEKSITKFAKMEKGYKAGSIE